ncbi:hypothetical protein [Flavobacterium branchiophilum]|uniref:Uncharacterized protein n=1 Tax=Flavobacterium branchiophilum TaxID=55197 RepID=A0A2H3KFT8_9FLAO|nr:hypothetical protein [Flavobacterium branchiophilum]PDS22256.1 hypothetical protein B0A77_13915 [Flavobacterium branchiophilum]
MELTAFSNWLKASYDFDSNENEFFSIALVQTFNYLNDVQIDKIPFFEYHQQPKLSHKILWRYLEQLLMLLKLIPQSDVLPRVIDGLNLHEFFRLKGELQLKIFELKNLFEGV